LAQVCCGTYEEKTNSYTAVECTPNCNSAVPGIRSVRLCNPDAAVDECASFGKTCTASQTLDGYYICK
jgi:hypothetical protein